MNSQLMLGQRFICWTEYEMTRKLLSWLGDRNYDSIFLGSAYIGNLLNFVLFHKSYGMVDFEGACWSATGNFFFFCWSEGKQLTWKCECTLATSFCRFLLYVKIHGNEKNWQWTLRFLTSLSLWKGQGACPC